MAKTILLITGGNTGLGYEAIKALLQSSHAYEILLGSRSLSKGEAAVKALQKEFPSSASTLTPLQIDVESDESIEAASASIASQFGHLDVLINNAGANFDHALRDGEFSLREAMRRSWDVNVAGTHVLTTALAPLLLKSPATPPRLLFITSGTSTLAGTTRFDNPALARINASPEAGWPKAPEVNPVTIYRSVKTGLNMLIRQWHRVLLNDGVKVFAVSPGFLATGLAGVGVEKLKELGARDPVEGANFIRDVVEGKRDDDAGQVVMAGGIQPW